MARTRFAFALLCTIGLGLITGGCSAVEPARDEAKVVVTVKFKSRFDADEIRKRYPKRMPQFRALPGLVQKYYLYDPNAEEWSGIYFWDSERSVAAYLESDLKKSIAEAYGVIGQPRVESFVIEDILR